MDYVQQIYATNFYLSVCLSVFVCHLIPREWQQISTKHGRPMYHELILS